MAKNNVDHIDFEKGYFEVNGTRYFIQIDKITVARFEIYERLSLELGFGASFEELFNTIKKAYGYLTEGESPMRACHEAAVLLMNQMHGIKDFAARKESKVLDFCTLFLNKEGEDLTEWSRSLADDKIADWQAIPMEDFFLLSTAAIRSFTEIYKQVEAVGLAKVAGVATSTPGAPTRKSSS